MSVHSFIAHFLKENGYHKTFKTFENEHGKQIVAELPSDESLVDIITDRMKYLTTEPPTNSSLDLLLSKDLREIKKNQIKHWSTPYPKVSSEIAKINDLVIDSAVMTLGDKEMVVMSTSAKSLIVVDLETGSEVLRLANAIGNIVIRKIVVTTDYIVLCDMQGKAYLCEFSKDILELKIISQTQIHARLIVEARCVRWNNQDFLVTMGWDFLVKVFQIDENGIHSFGESFKLANQGSCMDACVFNDTIVIVVGKSEITLLDVIRVGDDRKLALYCRIALNDAEFSASGFSPMCVKVYSDGRGVPLVAIGTSQEPFMRAIIVSLNEVGRTDDGVIRRNQIITNVNTMCPQDKYSQAVLEWRKDGSGLWVLGDDGVIRGVDLSTGKIAVELSGHDGRIKSLAVSSSTLISGGTDRRILQWS